MALLIPLIFSGCLEINEDISVAKNGSGKYDMKMDMGQMFEMMQSFMPAEELEKADLDHPRDTTVLLKDYIDTASNLTAEKKALLRDGSVHLKMNMAEKIFNIDMKYPFTTLDNFQKMYASIGESATGFGDMLKGLNGPGGTEGQAEQPNLNKIGSYFDIVSDKSSISRKLNKIKYAAMANDSMMEQMRGMSSMGGGMLDLKLNMTVHLPSAAKKISGVKAKLSEDKKTVTLNNNMLDIFEHPENFEFSVQF
ncbi:MAG: hypothetical protein ABI151_03040 [Chitinophagaceae bacterium]